MCAFGGFLSIELYRRKGGGEIFVKMTLRNFTIQMLIKIFVVFIYLGVVFRKELPHSII